MPPPPSIEALAAAVHANDAAAVARVLAESPELTEHLNKAMPGGAFGATPLLAAVYRGNREIVDVLLRAGADINARSHWWAGSFGVLDHDGPLTDYLIARGAVVDVHAAARLGMMERLETLISDDPALVHARGGDGQTPLHLASSVAIAQYLLDHGSEIDSRDVDHESTPAQYMVRNRQPIVRYLIERGCRTDVLMAAALGDVNRVTAFLDADPSCVRTVVSEEYFPKRNPRSGGCIYNWTLGTGKGAHTIAHEFGHVELFQVLMQRSPDELRLVVACETGNEAMVKELLAERADLAHSLTAVDRRKLPDAARDENVAAIRLMLSVGWPVDARGQHGGTALHWAGWNGNTDMTRGLIRYHPSLELTDHNHGGTPLGWTIYGSVHGWRCKTGNYAATAELLLDAGAKPPVIDDNLEASDAVRDVLKRRQNP